MSISFGQRWVRPATLTCAIAAQIFVLRLKWTFDTQTRPDFQRMNVASNYALLLESPDEPGRDTLLHYQASAIHNHFVTLEMASAKLSDQSQTYLAALVPPKDANQVAYAPERSSKPLPGKPCRAMFQVDFAPQTSSRPRSVQLYPPVSGTEIDNVRSINLESSSELLIQVSTNSEDETPGPGCYERLTMGKWEQTVGRDLHLAFIASPNSRVTISLSPDTRGPLHSSREELDSLILEPLKPRRLSIGPYGFGSPDQVRERTGQPFMTVKDLGLGGDFFSLEISGLAGVPVSEVLGAWKWLLFAALNLPLMFWTSKGFTWHGRTPTHLPIDARQASIAFSGKIRTFMSYSWEDKDQVLEVYDLLNSAGAEPWIDREEIRGGTEWELSIKEQMRNSQRVLIFLSSQSIHKAGFAWAEIRMAVRIAEEQPEGTPFIIPIRLDDCRLPDLLSRWSWIDLFRPDGRQQLLAALGLPTNKSESAQGSIA